MNRNHALLLAAALSVVACSETAATTDDTSTDDEDVEFESANPGVAGEGNADDDEADDTSTSGDDGDPGDGDEPPDDDPARDIEEADIVKVDGDRLYALSPYGGLSVVDIADVEDMHLLGRFKVSASPFEMYVRDGVAMVLYNGYGEYAYDSDGETWNWYQTSYVVAVDTETRDAPTELFRFEVPGYVSDSRIVGDVLYVVAFEDGYCWHCANAPQTHLLSLDVSNPSGITKVDELTFEEREGTYSWKRSVSATNEHLYVAGPTWGESEPTGSTIQVVDISDPSGQMRLGASVEVEGQIQSRWQMDEYEGVLRVVSQPFSWWREVNAPRIETFQVTSADEMLPLGSVAMQIPQNESLRSVRFDGPRGYAITAEQMDPLFTLDLSDPSEPKQVGELQMPGWVYHMEPRGERVLGLGYDQGNPEGAITVSLFDVADLESPKLLERVNFGGDWGSLAEDQDRIHKAFNILPDEGLLLVPFSGWSYDDAEQCRGGSYLSGVQLIDWAEDRLKLRGVAPATGRARRALVHDERLLTMSDDRLESFDIGDRDEPASLDRVSLALRADMAATDGQFVARIGRDWYSNSTELTVSALADVTNPDDGAIVALPQVERNECNGYSYLNQMLASNDRLYLQYHEYHWDVAGDQKDETARVISLDVSDASHPTLLGDAELDFTPSYGFGYVAGLVDTGTPLLAQPWGLVFSYRNREWDDQGNISKEQHTLKLVDMSDPNTPDTHNVALPDSIGSTGLLTNGKLVATSHFVQSPTDPNRVRFYLDRVEVGDPSAPDVLAPVNIPGSLLAYDADSAHALTLDYREQTTMSTAKRCYEELDGRFELPNPNDPYDYEHTEGSCAHIVQTLHLVSIEDSKATIEDSHAFEAGQHVGLTAQSGSRLFVSLARRYYGGIDEGVDADSVAYADTRFDSGTAPLFVFGGIDTGSLQVGQLEITTGNSYYGGFSQLVASGSRAVVASGFQGRLSVVDATESEQPRLVREVEVPGWISDLDVAGDTVIASLGYDGVASVSLDD